MHLGPLWVLQKVADFSLIQEIADKNSAMTRKVIKGNLHGTDNVRQLQRNANCYFLLHNWNSSDYPGYLVVYVCPLATMHTCITNKFGFHNMQSCKNHPSSSYLVVVGLARGLHMCHPGKL